MEKNIVLDTKTGLMWQRGETEPMTWSKAKIYAKKLRLGGYDDWRVPTIDELKTLIVKDQRPAINVEFFPKVYPDYYWSSTTNTNYTNHAWHVHVYYGHVSYSNKSYTYYVRCVRGGQ